MEGSLKSISALLIQQTHEHTQNQKTKKWNETISKPAPDPFQAHVVGKLNLNLWLMDTKSSYENTLTVRRSIWQSLT